MLPKSWFDDDFLDSLPEDPILAGKNICERFFTCHRQLQSQQKKEEYYEQYLCAIGLLTAFSESYKLDLRIPDITGAKDADIVRISRAVATFSETLNMTMARVISEGAARRFSARFGKIFAYEFSEGDLKRIQVLIDELRESISSSDLFEENHKQRLLKKLESLQSELHKKMSSLDKLWGFVGEAGIVLGKFGKDAKPFVDRITEILRIVWNTQARTEELPSGTEMPLLKSRTLGSDEDSTQ